MGAKATGVLPEAGHEACRVGVFAIACLVTIFSAIGCQTTRETAVNPTNPMCPVCGLETRTQAPGTPGYVQMACPTCGAAATVDQNFLDLLEVFIGGPVGDTVYACASCRTVVQQCAVCRGNGVAWNGRNARRWQ